MESKRNGTVVQKVVLVSQIYSHAVPKIRDRRNP